jgi:NTP pyrophosphatase (non-canonical NTP hydrolase)
LSKLAQEAEPTLKAFQTGDLKDDLARYGLCLVLEAAELVNALPWKHWARNPSSLEKASEEFADLLCFIGSLVLLFNRLGVSTADLTLAYLEKVQDNRDRFATYLEGYERA